jgi:hypothetical protein
MPSTPTIQTTLLEGRIPVDQEKKYFHLPFHMPEKAVRLEVEYSYSAQISSDPTVTGGNTIDLGIFDERGIDYLQAGFRGWSGSERHKFWITPTEAAPGYLPGPLSPGEWNILFGLYKLAPDGCDYRVEIRITITDSISAILKPHLAPQNLPATITDTGKSPLRAPGWFRGELHCHTRHSDGVLSAEQLLSLARQRGLDFVAVADHNTIASQWELEKMVDPGLILIRAVESTTFKGHFNVFGIPKWIDFRVKTAEEMHAAIQFANDLGALTSCNHPKPYGPDWDFPDVDNYHCIEVWNGPWTGMNEISLEFWVNKLASGRQIPAVGGSDFHQHGERTGQMDRNLGIPANWVHVVGTPSAEKILTSIRQGHVSLSETPEGPLLVLTAEHGIQAGDLVTLDQPQHFPIQAKCFGGAGSLLHFIDQRGVLLEKEIHQEEEIIHYETDTRLSRYVRVELRAADGPLRALTNPIYFSSPREGM